MPNALDPQQEDFHVTLMTIYSVENAGIRYVSAALQREGFDTSIIFLRDWVHNSLTMPTDEEIEIAMKVIDQKQPKLIGLGFMSSLYPNRIRGNPAYSRKVSTHSNHLGWYSSDIGS